MTDPLTPAEYDRRFHEELGRSIVQWHHVEAQLFAILERAISPKSVESLSAMFHTIDSVSRRAAMTHDALKYQHDGTELFKEWKTLKNRLSERASERNRLAHSSVVYVQHDGTSRPQLRPNIDDARNFKSPLEKHPTYELKHIEEMRASFGALAGALGNFALKVPRPEPSHPFSLPPR